MSQRTFQTVFIVAVVAAFLPIVFPLYGLANHEKPLVLGLPFSFFWVLLWVVAVGVAVIVLYFLDPENKNQEGE